MLVKLCAGFICYFCSVISSAACEERL